MIKHHYYFKILEFSAANCYSLQDFCLLLQIAILLHYFATNLVFLQRNPPPQKILVSIPKYPIATVWSSKGCPWPSFKNTSSIVLNPSCLPYQTLLIETLNLYLLQNLLYLQKIERKHSVPMEGTSTSGKKVYKGGAIIHTEPQDLVLFEDDPTFRASFERVGCMSFCQRIQGFYQQVTKDFALHFDGTKTKVGDLEFVVTPQTISIATRIPCTGMEWFKGEKFDLTHCSSFLKPEFKEVDIKNGLPRNFLIDTYADFLVVIQKYFTCEGRFNLAFLYHFRLLMHFTGKEAINIPFFLFRSIGKMSDKVQAKPSTSSLALFHSSLIKLLVLEELNKTGNTWESFPTSNNYGVILPSPRRPTPRIRKPFGQRIATPVPTSPPIQAPTPTHTP
jgi:hypothetical protein